MAIFKSYTDIKQNRKLAKILPYLATVLLTLKNKKTMVVVETMFFDSDDYAVETQVIPCDSKETAKAVVEKVYKKILDRYTFRDDDKRRQWENKNVERKKDGSIFIQGGDCGYAEINIVEKDAVTADTMSSLAVKISSFY